MDSQSSGFGILMFPWLAHGHIFPYLELSKRILTRKNFHIYFCTTAINFSSINNFIQANNLDHSIEVVELQLTPSPQLPPHYHTSQNLPPHLQLELKKAFQTAKTSFSDIVTTLKPDLVIYDVYQPWAARLSLSQGIPAVYFSVLGAAAFSYIQHQCTNPDDGFPQQELYYLKGYERKGLDYFLEFVYTNVFDEDKDIFLVNYKLSSEIILVKTTRGYEGKYLDYPTVCNKKLLPVGPLVSDSSDDKNSEILQWLSKRDSYSTVYISFGSEHFLSKEEINEIAKGLKLCEVNFIWVIRIPPGDDRPTTVQEALPEGFLDRVGDRGIVTGWAPQAKILKHPSTGAFISHCGWSSLMESLYFGVPIIGMPTFVVTFLDANMLVHAGAGVRVPRKENEGYKGEDIAEAITEVVSEKSGDGLRRRAQEFSEAMRKEEVKEMDVVAEHLWQLCLKNKL